MTLDKETNLVLSIAMVKNTNLDILIAKLIPSQMVSSLFLSFFSNGHCVCSGYLTHTKSPAGLVALHRFRLSNLYNINSLASLSLCPRKWPLYVFRLSNTYNIASWGFRLSNLYNINSLAYPVILFSLSSQMAIVCVQAI